MKLWWEKNWDKVVIVIVSAGVSGIVGFYSAVAITNERVADLRTKVAVLTERADDADIEIKSIAANTTAVNHLNHRFDTLKDRVELAELRAETIKELTELQRHRTINELRQLLEKYGRVRLTPAAN